MKTTWAMLTNDFLYWLAGGTDRFITREPVNNAQSAKMPWAEYRGSEWEPPKTLVLDPHRTDVKPFESAELPVIAPLPNQINWQDPSTKVSKYFTVGEVTQSDPRRIPERGSKVEKNILTLAAELDKIREAWGSAIGVTSWYRPPAVNREVGGVSNSQHINGSAADIYPTNGRDAEFEKWLDGFWGDRALGYGQAAGRGFTHVDLRPGGIRWNY